MKEKRNRGAEALLKSGFEFKKGDTVAVLYQQDSSRTGYTEAAKHIEEVAKDLGIRIQLMEFDRERFSGDNYPAEFSPSRLSKIGLDGIALLIELSQETSAGRLSLLRALSDQAAEWKIASMPGVDAFGLQRCIADYSTVRRRCEHIFAVMARSGTATIETTNPRGGRDELTLSFNGNRPWLSTGLLPRGEWANFPSGETFVLPKPSTANGFVTLNGSIPGMSMGKAEWVRFEVKKGSIRLDTIVGSRGDVCEHFLSLFRKNSRQLWCENANRIAELGVGANANTGSLTGHPIFDEKKLGTVHLGFGRNIQFDGKQDSCVHHDLVCRTVSLRLKHAYLDHEVEIVRDGKYVLNYRSAIPDLDKWPSLVPTNARFGITERSIEPRFQMFGSKPRVILQYRSRRGGHLLFPVAEGAKAELAKNLYFAVKENGWTKIDELCAMPSLTDGKTTFDKCAKLLNGFVAINVFNVKK